MLNRDPTEAPPAPTTRDLCRSPWDPALALTSLAAAAIHFAVTSDHFGEHVAFGLFFLIVAWGQALWAVGLLVAPRRWLLRSGVIGNGIVVATWALSRTAGVPVGSQPWTPEAIGVADLVSTGLELLIVGGCAARLALGAVRPRARIPAIAVGLNVVIVASVAMASVGDHSHTEGEGSTHAHTAAPASEGSHEDGHRLAGGAGELDLAQIDLVRAAMKKYRDVDVAFAQGWRSDHGDWPEIGSHFYRNGDWAGSFPSRPAVDLEDPEFLMYSKLLTGKWKLVAVAYVVDQARYPEPPPELEGALYHEHAWNCIADGEELEEEDWGVISREECEIMGGEWSPGGVWMTHVWLIDNPNGIFAETNPALVAI